MQTRAVILAAGHSKRMGHPKALTDIEGEPALARLVGVCASAGLARPVVVVGRDVDAIRAVHAGLDVEWVVNPDPDAGRTGSLQLGLARTGASRVLVAPIDHPLVTAGTVGRLLAASGEVVVPTFEGRGGHPILLAGNAVEEVRALASHVPLRDVVARDPARVVRLEVDDRGVIQNLDTPSDVHRALM